MKIGIVSIHSAHNYGSVLQAYALQESLKKYSDEVDMINYRPNYLDCQYSIFSIKVYKRYKGIINKILHFVWRLIMIPGRLKKYNKFEKFIKNNMNTTKKYLNYDELCKEKLSYDIVFVGSDQIWNTDITEGFDKTFYLGFLDDKSRRASYAASIGRKKLDEKYIELYKEYINKFDNISLREKSSVPILQGVTDKKINVTLDPTLLLSKKEWTLLSNGSKLKLNDEKYIFVYILQDNKEFVKIVNAISEILNLKVYSMSKKKRFKNEKIFPNAGPEDFLKLCNNSQFVITNSFHGTVFSLIFEKNNCIVPHLNTGGRMIDLMDDVGLSDRVISEYTELNINKILTNIDYYKVNKKLEKYINESLSYIKGAIINEKK